MRTRLLIVSLTVLAAACNRSASTSVEHAGGETMSGTGLVADSCPVHVPATTVTVVNTKDGVSMFFTTTPANVAEVRRRVAVIARMDPASDTESDVSPSVDLPIMGAAPELVPLRAHTQDLADGASLILKPLNPMDVEKLRAYALSQSYRMRLGRCDADFMKPPRRTGTQNADLPSETLG